MNKPKQRSDLKSHWFISPRYRKGSKLVLCAFLLAFVVITLGAYTRLTNAGLSCPDWPNCYGYLTAPHTDVQLQNAAKIFPLYPVNIKKAWTEMTHRYFAGTEGILVMLLSFSILFARKAKDLKATGIALLLIALLVIQVALGMLTVTEKLKPVIVLGHLLTGISLLGVLWWAYLDLYLRNEILFLRLSARSWLPWLITGFIIVVLQITLGGWTTTHEAGLACVDFPWCNGKLLPALHLQNLNHDLVTIHMLHRIGALITALYLGLLSLALIVNGNFRRIGIMLLALIALQIILGIFNIIWLRPVWLALIHQTVAILILLTMITLLVAATLDKGKCA